MNVDWDTNWAPTIVSLAGGAGLTFLVERLSRRRGKSKPHSKEIESTYRKGSTRRFHSVETWSRTRREYEWTADGGLRISEDTINFGNDQGTSTFSTKEIEDIWKCEED